MKRQWDGEITGKQGRGLTTPTLSLLAFCSGVSALTYEVVWTRLLSLRLGTTTAALTAVLAAFMLGLALGSWLFGRLADRISRTLRLYALLEAGIGLSALLVESGDLKTAATQYAVLARRTPADAGMLRDYADLLDRLGRHREGQAQRAAAGRVGG